ncbi:MAG: ABC transporter permease [Rhodoferax sp.]
MALRVEWGRRAAAFALAGAAALTLLWSLAAALLAALDAHAWTDLAAQPQVAAALRLSLFTGISAFAMALCGAASILAATHHSVQWPGVLRRLPSMLALPHAAFAIGVVLLVAPSGWLVRLGAALLSPINHWLGLALDTPPPWQSAHDPWGLGLLAVLACKEIPFLLWTAAAQLGRADLAHRLQLEMQVAQSLGYRPRTAWWRVVWPQLLPRLQAPLLAVLVYSLTVVDVALLAGPATPPTLAVLTWQWLQDPDPARNAMGAAGAWLLTGLVVAVATVCVAFQGLWRRWGKTRWIRGIGLVGRAGTVLDQRSPRSLLWLLVRIHAAVAAALVLGSVMGPWLFPALWPQDWTVQAWQAVVHNTGVVWTTAALAAASSAAALLWCVAWLESAPPAWQARMQALWYLPLLLPTVLWTLGLHQLTLAWGVDGSVPGLWLAHTLCVTPYVLLALQGPYGDFDPRLQIVSDSLGRSRGAYLWHIKWPLLRAPLAASFAVGFAVSVAQYLPTVYVGAGRFETVGTEALALAAGGQRSLMAAFAVVQWVLPVLVFGLATVAGGARRFKPRRPLK